MTCEGLQMLVRASCYLGKPIVQLVGHMVPFLLEQFGPLALDDVLKHHQSVDCLPVLITKNRSSEISPERIALLSQVPFLYFIAGNRTFKHLCGKKPILSDIIGVG